MRVLLVEDDELLGDGIRTGLKHYGHVVDWVKDGVAAIDAFSSSKEQFDIIVLDLGLPKVSGLEVLKTLRQRTVEVPVIILTAREGIDDRVQGLDAGADDYLTKPFDLDELCARIRALHRRSKSRAQPTITHGSLELDPAAYLIYQDGNEVSISRKEFALLQKLMENIGRVIPRDQLNQTLYGWEENIDSNALEVHIHNLRKRFGNDLIQTIRGIGYMIRKLDEKD